MFILLSSVTVSGAATDRPQFWGMGRNIHVAQGENSQRPLPVLYSCMSQNVGPCDSLQAARALHC